MTVAHIAERPNASAGFVGELIAFLLPKKKSVSLQLSPEALDVANGIRQVLDDMILRAIEKRTAPDFDALRNAVFPDYARIVVLFANLIGSILSKPAVERISAESICELESDLREEDVASLLGAQVRDQAIFTAWTVRKIADLSQQISSQELGDNKEAEEQVPHFLYHAIRTRFHLDCLTTSLRTSRPLYPEVSEVVVDGLRSAVDAYACLRQILDSCSPPQEVSVEPATPDEEDQQLLFESEWDMLREPAA
ncbi:MAG: hypothetical protein SFV54_27375 [Bryobacteraceae bacterium]|nr:hypothetical protein [Bryobacteraceae bacterium]